MATFSNIGLEEPSTITNRAATVDINRGGTVEQQEILVIGDPESSLGVAGVLDGTPASTQYGLVVREAEPTTSVRVHQSSAGDLNVTVAGYVAPSTIQTVSTGSVRVVQSSAADLNVTVAGYVAPSTTVAVSSGVVQVQPISSSGASLTTNANPASTAYGLITRDVGSVSRVDPNNGTTSTLAGDATFTGTGTDVEGYAAVAVQIYADEGSASSGMTFQFSIDDTNWDDVYRFTMSSGARRFQFPVTAKYFRVVYTNGSTAQNVFRVQTLLHPSNIMNSVHRLLDDVNEDRSGSLVKAAIIAQKDGSTNVFAPVTATVGGNLKVAIQEGTVDAVSSVAGRVLVDQNSTVWPVQVSSVSGQVSVVPITSSGLELTTNATPASTAEGLIVRQVDYTAPSTIQTVSTGSVRVVQSSAAELNVTVAGYSTTVNVSSLGGTVEIQPTAALQSSGDPVIGQAAALVEANPINSTFASGTLSSAESTIVAAITTSALCVYALHLTVPPTSSQTIRFVANSTVEKWRTLIHTTVVSGGVVEAVTPPQYLFKTAANQSLALTSSGGTANVTYSLSYFEEG